VYFLKASNVRRSERARVCVCVCVTVVCVQVKLLLKEKLDREVDSQYRLLVYAVDTAADDHAATGTATVPASSQSICIERTTVERLSVSQFRCCCPRVLMLLVSRLEACSSGRAV